MAHEAEVGRARPGDPATAGGLGQRLFRLSTRSAGLSYVAKEGDKQIVGFIFAQMVAFFDGMEKAVWVESIGVEPEFRRMGIGYKLLRKHLAWRARRKGPRSCRASDLSGQHQLLVAAQEAGLLRRGQEGRVPGPDESFDDQLKRKSSAPVFLLCGQVVRPAPSLVRRMASYRSRPSALFRTPMRHCLHLIAAMGGTSPRFLGERGHPVPRALVRSGAPRTCARSRCGPGAVPCCRTTPAAGSGRSRRSSGRSPAHRSAACTRPGSPGRRAPRRRPGRGGGTSPSGTFWHQPLPTATV